MLYLFNCVQQTTQKFIVCLNGKLCEVLRERRVTRDAPNNL